MEKLSFTLYEIFGYFLPGAVGIVALVILFWAIVLPAIPIPLQSLELSKLWYFGLVVVSYYSGHALQDISRWWFKNPDEKVLPDKKDEMFPVVQYAQEQISAGLGIKPDNLGNGALVKICDEVAVQYGQIGDRDVFVYREGFYRGSVAAFVLLDLALLVRCIIPGPALQLTTGLYLISRLELAFILVVVTCSIAFLFRRYKHFAALRVMRGVLAFVSISCFQGLGKKAEKAKAETA